MTRDTDRDLAAQTAMYDDVLGYARRSAREWCEAWCIGEGAWRMASTLGVSATVPWLHFKDAMIQIGNEQKEHTYQLDATAQ